MFKLQSSRAALLIAFLGWLLLMSSAVRADQVPATGGIDPPSYSEQANAILDEIRELNGRIGKLEANLKEKQGVAAMILDSRIQDASHRALELSHQLCQLVIDREAAAEDPGSFRKTAQDLLQLIPKRVRTDVQRQLASEDNGVDITTQSAIEQIAFEDERAELSKRLLESYGILLRNLQLSEQLGLETTQQRQFLLDALAEAAQKQSIGLELARRYGKVLERQSRALPDDAELAAKVRVSGERIRRLNDGLRQLVE
mgnify:FL=1